MSLLYGLICALAFAQDPQPPTEPLIGPQPAAVQPTPPAGPDPATPVVAPVASPATADPNYDRLLGDEPPPPTPESPDAVSLPVWVWPMAGLLVVLVIGGRYLESRRRRSAGPPLELRLVSRLSRGREGQLAVIEVADGAGAYRRLLVGLGGGAPRLVMELDSSTFETALVANGLPPAARARPAEARRAAETRAPTPRTPSEAPSADRPQESRARAATARPPAPDSRRPLAVRSDLIQEVLAEREGPPEGEPPAEEQEKPPAYTFRGLLG